MPGNLWIEGPRFRLGVRHGRAIAKLSKFPMPVFGFRPRAEESPIDSRYCYLAVTVNAGLFGAPATGLGLSLLKCEMEASIRMMRAEVEARLT